LKRMIVVLLCAGLGCRRDAVPNDERLAELRRVHDGLHQDLDAVVADDAFVQEAFKAEGGDLILAVRSSLVQTVLRRAASIYLDQVLLNLSALEAKAGGDIRHKTLLGKVRIGDWRLEMMVEALEVRLKAKTPRLRVMGPNELNLQLPVEAMEAPGRLALRFVWNSASVANLVCRDFELVRQLEGRTLRQEHTIGGTFRLSAGPGTVRVEPVFPDDVIRMQVDLSPASWAVVDEALRSQDSLGKCGLLIDPEKVLGHLKALASEGFKVRLPRVMFRGLRLPGMLERTARIDGRPVAVAFRTRGFEATSRAMWSRAAIEFEGGGPGKQNAAGEALECHGHGDKGAADCPEPTEVPGRSVVDLPERVRCTFESKVRPATDRARRLPRKLGPTLDRVSAKNPAATTQP
jgi:hypothetical protein